MSDPEGKVAIVTGASSGIGRAAAKLFAKSGAKVVVGARREGRAQRAWWRRLPAEGGKAVALAGQTLATKPYAGRPVDLAVQKFGRSSSSPQSSGIIGEKGRRRASRSPARRGPQSTDQRLPAPVSIPEMAKRGQGLDRFHQHLACRPARSAFRVRSLRREGWFLLRLTQASPPRRPAGLATRCCPAPWIRHLHGHERHGWRQSFTTGFMPEALARPEELALGALSRVDASSSNQERRCWATAAFPSAHLDHGRFEPK